MYIIRLDDAAYRRDIEKWNKIEEILSRYDVKPIIGIIPNCKDPDFEIFDEDENFINRIHKWKDKGWEIAMHGNEHIFETNEEGINPINKRSEFAGVSLDEQRKKIREGINFFKNIDISPTIFFAPAHTFDENTLNALKLETDIRIISDTIANDIYYEDEFYFIPSQSGCVRKLPFKTVTFCYHPNNMTDEDFEKLEKFIKKHKNLFVEFKLIKRKRNLYDKMLEKLYFNIRKIRRKKNEN